MATPFVTCTEGTNDSMDGVFTVPICIPSKLTQNASQHIQHHLNLLNSPPTQIIFLPTSKVFQVCTKPQIFLFVSSFPGHHQNQVKTCPLYPHHLAVNFVRCRALPPPHLLKPPPRRGRRCLLHEIQGERSRRRPHASWSALVRKKHDTLVPIVAVAIFRCFRK